jgi:hypothetical protein
MPSPFPGMDPYLEASWGDVHTSMAVYIRNQLNRQMPKALRAQVQSSVAIEVDDPRDDDVVRFFPDVQVETGKRNGRSSMTAVTTAEPLVVTRRSEPETVRSVQIVTRDGGKLVTAIEILSPSNKVGRTGRDAFREKQTEILGAKASLVVIDLIRAGRHVIAVPLAQLPVHARQGYMAVVIRGWKRDKAEVYTLSMREKLPAIKIPLRRKDPDAPLDLQAILTLAYDDGGHESTNYRRRLEPGLEADDEAWADQLLRAAKKR